MLATNKKISMNDSFNIINLLLIDYSTLKENIRFLTVKNILKKDKVLACKKLFTAFNKHCEAKEKTLYDSLFEMEEVRSCLLEGQIEYNIIKKENKIPHLSISSRRPIYRKDGSKN